MKKRLDFLLVEKGISKSRSAAVDLIKRGEVMVNGVTQSKPSTDVEHTATVTVLHPLQYVSRGGLKLEHALTEWNIDVTGKIAIDIGSSTGGFTDCLLQRGITKVYAIDVGTNQLDQTLKGNPKVIEFEKTDFRNVHLDEKVDIAVVDLSFISITKLLPIIKNFLTPHGIIVALIKPQFEVGRENINKNGIVKDEEVRGEMLKRIKEETIKQGFEVHSIIESPILGGSGNTEYLMHATSLPTKEE